MLTNKLFSNINIINNFLSLQVRNAMYREALLLLQTAAKWQNPNYNPEWST